MDRRPAAEDLDKKSELTNKLYNDLSAKIDDVDSSLQRETKRTRGELDKILKDLRSTQSKCEDISVKEIQSLKEDLSGLRSVTSEVKTCNKDITIVKNDCDKNTKDISALKLKLDEMKKELTSTKTETTSLSNKFEKLQLLEKEFEQIKRDKN